MASMGQEMLDVLLAQRIWIKYYKKYNRSNASMVATPSHVILTDKYTLFEQCTDPL